jgi:hypothetical protein
MLLVSFTHTHSYTNDLGVGVGLAEAMGVIEQRNLLILQLSAYYMVYHDIPNYITLPSSYKKYSISFLALLMWALWKLYV